MTDYEPPTLGYQARQMVDSARGRHQKMIDGGTRYMAYTKCSCQRGKFGPDRAHQCDANILAEYTYELEAIVNTGQVVYKGHQAGVQQAITEIAQQRDDNVRASIARWLDREADEEDDNIVRLMLLEIADGIRDHEDLLDPDEDGD